MNRNLMGVLIISVMLIAGIGGCIDKDGDATTTISLETDNNTIESGEQFLVNIIVDPNQEISGVQVYISYNSSFLWAWIINEGDLFGDSPDEQFTLHNIDNHNGTLWVATAVTNPSAVTDNEGTLATIQFMALQPGTINLNLYDKILVYDKEQNELPFELYNLTLDITGFAIV